MGVTIRFIDKFLTGDSCWWRWNRDRSGIDFVVGVRESEIVAGRVPPHDIESEKAVLSAILLDNDAIHSIVTEIHEEDFYHPSHQMLFRSMVRLKDAKGGRENWLMVKDNDAAAHTARVPFAQAVLQFGSEKLKAGSAQFAGAVQGHLSLLEDLFDGVVAEHGHAYAATDLDG